MSLYLMSDIHGDINSFKKLLKNVDLKKDKLLILGDAVDRGEKSIETLQFIMTLFVRYPGRISMLKGNHELFLSMWIDGDPMLSERSWISFGGAPTLASLRYMSESDVDEIKGFVDSLPLYREIESPVYGACVATHSGLDAQHLVLNPDGTINAVQSIIKGYEASPFRMLCSDDIHYLPAHPEPDRYMIVGHVPCTRLTGSHMIIRTKRYMDIDSGANPNERKLGGRLSMYCVDTDTEYYA